MATELACPICDADIFLDGEEKSGDIIQCSYCKESLKIFARKKKWIVTEDFDELG